MQSCTKPNDYVFVLWADKFEETLATIFVTELRQAGLLVKIVGLTPRPIRGRHGLILEPDLTLDQALVLATQVICLIIPHPGQGLGWFKNDPRIAFLFEQIAANRARVIIGASSRWPTTDLGGCLPVEANLSLYPAGEALGAFVRDLACSLLRTV